MVRDEEPQNGMKKMNYTTVPELLVDGSFLAWYHQMDRIEVCKWEEWMEADTENKELAEEAVHLLELILLAEERVEITEQQISAAVNRIRNAIAALEKSD